jgi:hypothetical protein
LAPAEERGGPGIVGDDGGGAVASWVVVSDDTSGARAFRAVGHRDRAHVRRRLEERERNGRRLRRERLQCVRRRTAVQGAERLRFGVVCRWDLLHALYDVGDEDERARRQSTGLLRSGRDAHGDCGLRQWKEPQRREDE